MALKEPLWMENPPAPKRRRSRKPRRRSGRARRNPHLAVMRLAATAGNPGGKMARRRRDSRGRFLKRGHARRRSRRTRARRNAAIPFYNPRRRRARSHRRRHRRNAAIPFYNRARRRHRRHNPGFGGIGRMFGGLVPPIESVALGVVGCAGQRLVFKQVVNRFMPDAVPWAVNSAVSAALTGVIGRMILGRERGNKIAVGAFICALDQIAQSYVYPTLGLDAYLDPGMHAYLDPGMHQYLNPGAVLPAMPSEGMSGFYDEDYGMHGVDSEVSRLDAGHRL